MSDCGKIEMAVSLDRETDEQRMNFNFKMNERLILRNLMVTNYQRMMEQCAVYEKEQEKLQTENARYELVGQCLKNKIVELTGCKLGKSPTGSDNDDAVTSLNLEMCCNKLMAELVKYRDKAEESTRELAKARDRLAQASEVEQCLSQCAATLTVLAERDRIRRDYDEVELRTVVRRLTAELVEARRAAGQLQSDVDEMTSELEQMERRSQPCGGDHDDDERLRADNIRLQADLKAAVAVEAKLRAKVARSKTVLQARTHAQDPPSRDIRMRPGCSSESRGGSSVSLSPSPSGPSSPDEERDSAGSLTQPSTAACSQSTADDDDLLHG